MHEICHGLGPAFARPRRPGRCDIREAIGGAYSGLEEAKADVVGMFALKWLVDRGVLPKDRLEEYYASYVAGIFRTVRFGTGEAHGRAEMMEFNYLVRAGRDRVRRRPLPRRLREDAGGASTTLAKELLEQEATGDRARTEAWFAKYDRMPPALTRRARRRRRRADRRRSDLLVRRTGSLSERSSRRSSRTTSCRSSSSPPSAIVAGQALGAQVKTLSAVSFNALSPCLVFDQLVQSRIDGARLRPDGRCSASC